MKTPNTKPNSILSKFLDTVSDLDQKKTDTQMLLAAKIDDAIKAKGWKKKDLLSALGKKNPSLVTKWLSGTHNFTVDTLVALEDVLDIELFNLSIENRLQYKASITIFSQEENLFSWKNQLGIA